MRVCFVVLVWVLLIGGPVVAQEAPRENPYDVLGKMLRPFLNVLLTGGKDADKAMTLEMKVTQVSGRLPKQFEGATLRVAVQFPDKVRLEAPVFGEPFIVCRNGSEVWATPGQKIRFLLDQFKLKPQPVNHANTPLFLPFTAQQAVFLVALFTMQNPNVAEMDTLNGETCRVLTARLMPELAKSANAEDFEAAVWIAPGYAPRQVEIVRGDFSALVEIASLKFSPSLPDSEWTQPTDATDIFRTTSGHLEQLIYVVLNSLQAREGDQPWLNER